MKIQILLIPLVLLLILSCEPQQKFHKNPTWFSAVDSLVYAEHNNNRFDGTIVIGNSDEILYRNAIGIANRSWDVPIDSDTHFDIASLNKSFQAALLLMAVEEGKLSLSDELTDFFNLPGFDQSITIHQLLTHTAGLPDYNSIETELQTDNFRDFKRKHFSSKEYVAFISELKPVALPGESFHYSNFGYHLLAIILEYLYNQPFHEILREKICKPFGLTNTFSDNNNQQVHERLAIAYNFSATDSSYYKNNFIDLTLGRRIFSTSEDLYNWSNLLESGKIVSAESYRLMTTNHVKTINKNVSYGYGFVIFDGDNYPMGNLNIDQPYIIHGGATEGFKSMLTNINNGELIVTHLSNIGDRTNELNLSEKIVHLIVKE